MGKEISLEGWSDGLKFPDSGVCWARMNYADFKKLLANEALPCAIVDLDAVMANLDVALERLGPPPLTVRVASKSVRLPAVLDRLLAHPRVQGLMTYSAAETLWLAEYGVDDILLAYPVGRPVEAEQLVRAGQSSLVRAMVDSRAQVDLLSTAAQASGTELRVCIDVDASAQIAGMHAGVRRSPIRSVEAALKLASHIRSAPGVQLDALMSYEAVVAGMADRTPGSRWLDPLRSLLKAKSRSHVAALRPAVVAALREKGHTLHVVNGGGTGSIRSTSADESCTEVTVGSGFFAPHLFDNYHDLPLTPAAFFALSVCRVSDPGFVTCFGGGYAASGEAGASRLPKPHLPEGLQVVSTEGFGEVQTPLQVPPGTQLSLGDPVICRHAKAGELMAWFDDVILVEAGRELGRAATYRGARTSTGEWPFVTPSLPDNSHPGR